MNKQELILSKFSEDFKIKVQEDPHARAAFEMLIRDIDPYNVIEQLVNNSIDAKKAIHEYISSSNVPHKVIVEANSDEINSIIDDTVETISPYVNEWFDSSSEEMKNALEELKAEWRLKVAKKIIGDDQRNKTINC